MFGYSGVDCFSEQFLEEFRLQWGDGKQSIEYIGTFFEDKFIVGK